MSSKNHKHKREYCPQCQTVEYTLYDNHLDETYCNRCGLVLTDNTLIRVTLEIEAATRKDNYIRSLWKKKRSIGK